MLVVMVRVKRRMAALTLRRRRMDSSSFNVVVLKYHPSRGVSSTVKVGYMLCISSSITLRIYSLQPVDL
ncbi:hypothetical protein VTO73DRAFT_7575 [Trametes versicolor]